MTSRSRPRSLTRDGGGPHPRDRRLHVARGENVSGILASVLNERLALVRSGRDTGALPSTRVLVFRFLEELRRRTRLE